MYKIGLKVLLGWVLFLPITAYSLGLGEIDVKSFLNQPLKAEITIISARPGEVDDLLVGLANRDAFARASLSRPSHLSALKFKVIKSEDGTSAIISVKTQTAVKEPVLNFLVEADWAKGKVFREFTILLDPPYFAQQFTKPTPKAKTAKPFSKPNTVVKPTKQTIKQPEPIVNQVIENNSKPLNDGYVNESSITEEYSYDLSSTESSTPVEQAQAENSQNAINIVDGATLWSVAKTIKTDDVSMSQVMLALQRINQDAFGQNNINNLKQGAVLRVPTQQDYADLSQRDAYIEVLNQNGLWNDYLVSVGHASANASNTQSDNATNTSDASEPTNGALSIVVAGEGESDKAALRSNDDVKQISNLRKQLLLSEEEVESLKVEKDDLSSRLKMLEAELDKRSQIDNLLTIEDGNLATMEQTLATAEVESETLSENDVDSAMVKDEMSNDSMEENVSDAAEMIANELESTEGGMMSDEMTDTMDSDSNADEASEMTVMNEEPTAIVQAPATIIVSETDSSSSMIDGVINALTSNPIVQGAIAIGLLLILLGAKFLKGRKEKQSTEKELDTIEDSVSEDPIDTQSGIIIPNVDDDDETPINVPQMENDQPIDDFTATIAGVNAVEEDEDEFSKTAIISADDMATLEVDAAEEQSDEQDETLDEVDVYLAYSLFDNAEELLKEKLAITPDRADYRAKLLDTYFATQNKDAFIDEASSLKDLGDKSTKYWAKVQAMGFELDGTNPMFADGEGGDVGELAIVKPEVADFDIGAEGDEPSSSDFDLSLDGDGTNFDLSGDAEDDAPLEFNLDDDLSSGLEKSDEELPDDLDSLDFDFDELVEEPDSVKESKENASKVDEGLEFTLDDDLDEKLNESVAIDETAVIEVDDLEFTVDEIEDDALDISIDDIEPDINIEDDLVDIESTGTMAAFTEEAITDAAITDAAITEKAIEEDDLIIEDNEDDIVILDETVSFSSEDDVIDLDLEIDGLGIDGEDDLVDFDVVEESDIELEEEVSFDETVNMPLVDEDRSIEKTEIVSSIDLEEELVIPDIEDIEDIDDIDDIEDITDIANIEGLMLPDDVDEVATKLDLAKAFKDMGDAEGARHSLEEVLEEGSDEQQAEAQALLNDMSK